VLPDAKAVKSNGFVRSGFEAVAEAFAANFASEAEVGAAFAAYVDGEVVVDLWAGLADRHRGWPWERDTLVGIFSGSKGMVATCLLLLLERGLLELESPVAQYWPEFAEHGKECILVRDVVSHQAGLPGLETPVTIAEVSDDLRMASLLAEQSPALPPGTGPRYHAVTFGWLGGELVRRVDGRSIGRFLHEEIAAPLDLDIWIGLPEEFEARVAVIERSPDFGLEQSNLGASSEQDPISWSIWSNPPRFAEGQLAANDRRWHAAEIPATNGIVTARSLARLYGCLAIGGEIDGVRLLSPETIAQGRHCLARGVDPDVGAMAIGIGYELQTENLTLGPPSDAFGHTGAGGSVHGAWPSLRTGFSYTPNQLGSMGPGDARATALLHALYTTLGQT
jgi:CubicO group peptidase (beta-lactamase class C family)